MIEVSWQAQDGQRRFAEFMCADDAEQFRDLTVTNGATQITMYPICPIHRVYAKGCCPTARTHALRSEGAQK